MIRLGSGLVLLVALTATGVCAQSSGSPPGSSPGSTPEATSTSSPGPVPYGNGEKPPLNYAGTSYPRNIFLLSVYGGSTYDTNVFGDNREQRGALIFEFGPRLAFRRESPRLTLGFDYQPDFRIYRDAADRNVLNHGLGLDMSYQVSSHFQVRARESASYRTGLFPPRAGEEFMPGLGSPSGLNDTVLLPLQRQLESNTRFDMIYFKSARSSFDFFGGWVQRDFLGQEEQESGGRQLRDTKGVNTGMQYLYRMGSHSAMGALYLLQNLSLGKDTRYIVHSWFYSYTRQLSPSLTLDVFGGPQYTRLHDEFVIPLGFITISGRIFRSEWHWATGGTLTKQLENTALRFSAQRRVTDGGGLLGAVTSTSVGTSIHRRLGGRWAGTWDLSYGRNDALGFGVFAGTIQTAAAGFELGRSLTEKLSFRAGYGFSRQRTEGSFLLLGNIDRHTIRGGFSYDVGRFPLGR